MNDYRRFVSYIYNYEEKIKKNNVGYARVETKENQCKITIHIQVKSIQNGKMQMGGFIRKDMDLVGIPIGEIGIKNGNGDCQISTTVEKFGNSTHDFSKLGGLILYLSQDKYFGTEWDDKPLVFGDFDWEKKKETKELKEPEELKKSDESDESEEPEEPVKENIVNEPGEVAAAEIKMELFALDVYFKPYNAEELYERFAYRMNDNFIQHAYHRFGHIGVWKKGEQYILGVPGIFCRREQEIAKRADYQNFVPKTGETLKYGDFGYWYKSMEYLK